jgi:hypothetical protein
MTICLKRESNTRFKRSSGMERWLGWSSQGFIYLLKTDNISSAKQEQDESSNLSYYALLLLLPFLLLLLFFLRLPLPPPSGVAFAVV